MGDQVLERTSDGQRSNAVHLHFLCVLHLPHVPVYDVHWRPCRPLLSGKGVRRVKSASECLYIVTTILEKGFSIVEPENKIRENYKCYLINE